MTSRSSVRIVAAVLASSWLALTGAAHPVAQGAMEIRVQPQKISVRARVSTEEVFVASAFATGGAAGRTLDEVWRAHGPYLLNHLQLFADGVPLTGKVSAVLPPGAGASIPGPTERAVYELEYPLPSQHAPASLRLEENVLKEFTYAPGNPWTASYVVRIDAPGRAPVEGLLLDRNQPLQFAIATPAAGARDASHDAPSINQWHVAREYLVHGVFHILTGYDHMLFMGALVLAAMSLWDLIKVVSAFTLAHTITLTLSVLDIVRLPERIVEPMIAASIVFVAVQNVLSPGAGRSWGRLLIAFFFGLFHGLGFAGGLLDAMAGLPPLAIGTAIAAFSLGVELGHQAVVLPVFGGLKLAEHFSRGEASRYRVRFLAERYGSALISLAGMFYLVVALRG